MPWQPHRAVIKSPLRRRIRNTSIILRPIYKRGTVPINTGKSTQTTWTRGKAYQDAEQRYQDALLLAESMRQTAYEAAQAQLDQDLENAASVFSSHTEQYYLDYYRSLNSILTAYDSLVEAALVQVNTALDEAGQIYLQGECAAWLRYEQAAGMINEWLESKRTQLNDQLERRVEAAIDEWHEKEAVAWQDYQNAMAQMLGQEQPREIKTDPPDQPRVPPLPPQGVDQAQRKVPERQTNSFRDLKIPDLFKQWASHLWEQKIRFQVDKIPDPTSWDSLAEWFRRMRNRIPASILYVGLLKNLDSFKAGITVSGIVGKETYKIQKVEVVQNQRHWSVTVPKRILQTLRDILPGGTGDQLGVRFEVKIKQQEIAEDGSWVALMPLHSKGYLFASTPKAIWTGHLRKSLSRRSNFCWLPACNAGNLSSGKWHARREGIVVWAGSTTAC
jgi:hypothetical protein